MILKLTGTAYEVLTSSPQVTGQQHWTGDLDLDLRLRKSLISADKKNAGRGYTAYIDIDVKDAIEFAVFFDDKARAEEDKHSNASHLYRITRNKILGMINDQEDFEYVEEVDSEV